MFIWSLQRSIQREKSSGHQNFDTSVTHRSTKNAIFVTFKMSMHAGYLPKYAHPLNFYEKFLSGQFKSGRIWAGHHKASTLCGLPAPIVFNHCIPIIAIFERNRLISKTKRSTEHDWDYTIIGVICV